MVGARITKWAGISGRLTGLAGVNVDVPLDAGGTPDVGGNAAYAWGASAVVRPLQRKTTALSIRPEVFGVAVRGVSVTPILLSLLEQFERGEGVSYPEAQRFGGQRGGSLGGLVNVSLAQSFGRVVGLQVGLAGGAREDRLRVYMGDGEYSYLRATQGLFNSGLALSVDTYPVPMAIIAEYKLNLSFAADIEPTDVTVRHDAGLGLFYNGMTQNVGLSVGASLSPKESITLTAQLVFCTFF